VVLGAAVSVVKRLFVVADAYAAKKARVFAEKKITLGAFYAAASVAKKKRF
jgi:hypothetical protein